MVPLTTRDYSPAASIPLPPRFIEAFGLDDRSRIVWDDVNDFAWVGPDVRAGSLEGLNSDRAVNLIRDLKINVP